MAHLEGLNEAEIEWVNKLNSAEYGQGHLIAPFATATPEQKKALIGQIATIDYQYPGGVLAYIQRAKVLLEQSKNGTNPFEGFVPSVPEGEKLDVGTPRFFELEAIGEKQFAQSAFVLVAGGLGERLGYKGIKVGLPSEICTGTVFLDFFIQNILAIQARASQLTGNAVKVPLAIMTSDDTHLLTVQLLEDNNYFGMDRDQLTIMKQAKVPALTNNYAHFATASKDPFMLETKPHGHGDVHTLLHQHGLVNKWHSEGRRWIVFFQDTNVLVFKAVPLMLGTSAAGNFAINTLAVPRTAGEAAGAICKLTHASKNTLTINVEYNQLDPMLKAAGMGGDVADESGYSPYPGNTNVLVFEVSQYKSTLDVTGGAIPEFVNPKYKDAEKIEFKSATRLECMMQDFPKLMPPEARVGFVQLPRWFCFSAVKNNVTDAAAKAKQNLPAECASSSEADLYRANARLLQLAGNTVEINEQKRDFAGVPVAIGPLVVFKPSFSVTVKDVVDRVKGCKVSARSAMVLSGDARLDNVQLDGALEVHPAQGVAVHLKDLVIENKGWELVPIPANDVVPEALAIRGYHLVKHATHTV